MKTKSIIWVQHPDFQDNHQGKIDEQEIFTIVNIGKKDQLFELKSWPIRSDTFHFSTSSKKLGEYRTLAEAKTQAEIKWSEFTNSLMQTEQLISLPE